MGVAWYIAIAASILVAVSAATGWWRLSFALFRLNPKRMTVDRLGLRFTSDRDVQRVNRIFESFVGGFNSMICGPTWRAWQRYAGTRPSLYSPFAQAGWSVMQSGVSPFGTIQRWSPVVRSIAVIRP